jgi:hypothetical protein
MHRTLAPLGHPETQVHLGRMVSKDCPDLLDPSACLVSIHLCPPIQMVTAAYAPLVLAALLDRLDRPGPLGTQDHPVAPELPEIPVDLEPLAPPGHKDRLDLLVNLDQSDLKVTMARREEKDQTGPLDQTDHVDQRDPAVLLAIVVTLVAQAFPDHKGHLDPRDHPDDKDSLAAPDHGVTLEKMPNTARALDVRKRRNTLAILLFFVTYKLGKTNTYMFNIVS